MSLLKLLFSASSRLIVSRCTTIITPPHCPLLVPAIQRNLSSIVGRHNNINDSNQLLCCNVVPQVQPIARNLIKFSFRKGRRKTVRVVLSKFYRLRWGGWIRTMCGRHRKLWRKSPPRKRRLRQHMLCNATQSRLLDKMVGRFWMKPKYFVDDPYEPYHSREEHQFTYKKPRPYFPPEEKH